MFNPIKIRFFLFLIGCFGSRLVFTAVSAFAYGWLLLAIGILALIPVFSWAYIIFIGKRDTGIEVLGDKIWWKTLRPVHMLIWGFFSYLAITGNRKAWLVLLLDTVLGLSSFLIYHWSQDNLKKIQ